MSDRVLKCFNCGGEGHYAKDCQNGTFSPIQNVWKTGPTPTEQPTGIMIAGEETETTGQEATPATTADSPAISQESALNRGRSNDRGRIDGESNIGVERKGKALFASTARRAAILLGTVTLVQNYPFRAFSLVL